MTVLTFDLARPPLNANQRLHWAKRAKLTREVREATFDLAPRSKAEHIIVQLVWVVSDRRRRDSDNTYPTFKAMCDGLVDAGIVPDDTPEYMTKLGPVIRHDPWGKPRLELHIEWGTP